MTAIARSLLAGAAITTLADGLVYLLLIVPGRVAETNQLIVGLMPAAATGVKIAEVLWIELVAIVLLALGRYVGVAIVLLAVATVAGLLGVVTTIGAAL